MKAYLPRFIFYRQPVFIISPGQLRQRCLSHFLFFLDGKSSLCLSEKSVVRFSVPDGHTLSEHKSHHPFDVLVQPSGLSYITTGAYDLEPPDHRLAWSPEPSLSAGHEHIQVWDLKTLRTELAAQDLSWCFAPQAG
jgi:hypothetical protein